MATKEKAARPCQVEAAQQTAHKPKRTTKIDRVIAALHHPHGMNRFEAARLGDTCLNSTVAVIRGMYGSKLISQWETVPCRFTERGVRVLRYWITGEATR